MTWHCPLIHIAPQRFLAQSTASNKSSVHSKDVGMGTSWTCLGKPRSSQVNRASRVMPACVTSKQNEGAENAVAAFSTTRSTKPWSFSSSNRTEKRSFLSRLMWLLHHATHHHWDHHPCPGRRMVRRLYSQGRFAVFASQGLRTCWTDSGSFKMLIAPGKCFASCQSSKIMLPLPGAERLEGKRQSKDSNNWTREHQGITRQPACVFARPCEWIQPAKELYHPAKQLACLVLPSLYLREYPTRRRLSVTLLQVRKQGQSNATFVCLVCINDRTFWTIAPALCLLLEYWCHRRFPPKARSHGLMSVHGWDCFPDPSSA